MLANSLESSSAESSGGGSIRGQQRNSPAIFETFHPRSGLRRMLNLKQEIRQLNSQRKMLQRSCLGMRLLLGAPISSSTANQVVQLTCVLAKLYKSSLIANIEVNEAVTEDIEFVASNHVAELVRLVKANTRLLSACVSAASKIDDAIHYLEKRAA